MDYRLAYEHMKATMMEKVLHQWTPRMLVAGVDHNDLLRTLAKTKTWDDWLPNWVTLADEQRDKGLVALKNKSYRTAETYLRKAALSYHYAHFMWFGNMAEKNATWRKEVDSYKLAAALAIPAEHRIEVPWQGHKIVGYLRMPTGVSRPPLLVFCPGADAWKEELASFQPFFLERGVATLIFDGPGQGELGEHIPLRRTNYEECFSALVDWVEANWPQIDTTRLGTCGISMGGYYAPRCAAKDQRVSAACGIGGPFGGKMPEGYGHPAGYVNIGHVLGARDTDEAKRMREEIIDLSDCIADLKCPLLIIHGALDQICLVSDAKKIIEESSSVDPTLVIYEDGNHVCNNHSYEYRSLAADWMAEKLGARC